MSICERLINAKGKSDHLQDIIYDLNHYQSLDIERSDQHGNTPLIYAAQFGYVPVLKVLLRRGANVESTNLCKETPLIAALKRDQFDAAWELLDEDANYDCVDNDGNTPLKLALKRKHVEIAWFLFTMVFAKFWLNLVHGSYFEPVLLFGAYWLCIIIGEKEQAAVFMISCGLLSIEKILKDYKRERELFGWWCRMASYEKQEGELETHNLSISKSVGDQYAYLYLPEFITQVIHKLYEFHVWRRASKGCFGMFCYERYCKQDKPPETKKSENVRKSLRIIFYPLFFPCSVLYLILGGRVALISIIALEIVALFTEIGWLHFKILWLLLVPLYMFVVLTFFKIAIQKAIQHYQSDPESRNMAGFYYNFPITMYQCFPYLETRKPWKQKCFLSQSEELESKIQKRAEWKQCSDSLNLKFIYKLGQVNEPASC